MSVWRLREERLDVGSPIQGTDLLVIEVKEGPSISDQSRYIDEDPSVPHNVRRVWWHKLGQIVPKVKKGETPTTN